MHWILIEILVPLALFVFIIWWTLPSKPKGGRDEEGK
jgi:hypothetical protein